MTEIPEEVEPPRFVELPRADTVEVAGVDGAVGVDVTYQPPGRPDPFTVRVVMSPEQARRLAEALSAV